VRLAPQYVPALWQRAKVAGRARQNHRIRRICFPMAKSFGTADKLLKWERRWQGEPPHSDSWASRIVSSFQRSRDSGFHRMRIGRNAQFPARWARLPSFFLALLFWIKSLLLPLNLDPNRVRVATVLRPCRGCSSQFQPQIEPGALTGQSVQIFPQVYRKKALTG
jgi:hypothetical protein